MDENLKEKDNWEKSNFLWWFIIFALIFNHTGNNWNRNKYEELNEGDNKND